MGRSLTGVEFTQTSGFSGKTELTVATSNAVAYTAEDQVGVVMTLDQLPLEDTALVTIQDVIVIDKDKQNAKLVIFFYNASVTGVADNAAASMSDADQAKCENKIVIEATDYSNSALNSVAAVACQLLVRSGTNSQIRVVVKTEGTPTYTSTSGLVLKFGYALDFK